MTFNTLKIETFERVVLIQLNRPEALNALNKELIDELDAALSSFDADPSVGCIVLTGSQKAFAAGADIKEMRALSFVDALLQDFIARWDSVSRTRKPIVAAVSGFALGGGCELAMMCDFIIAAETANFGQPEIKLGVIPGAGGTQRLARAVGKAKAMDLVLTGRMMGAQEAERAGLVARVTSESDLIAEALKAAAQIAAQSLPALILAKDAVNQAFETTLAEGVKYERRLFYALFATEDQKEGMAAFTEKRKPAFKHR